MAISGPEQLVTFRSFRNEDRAWVLETHVRFYRTAHGFNSSFRDAVAAALDLLEAQMPAAASQYVIAEAEEGRVGCVFLSADGAQAGRVRLFYLEDAYRGRGIGRRLLKHVVAAAEAAKLSTVRVSTFDRHPEACRLYERYGFRAVGRTPTEAFGQFMTQVDYELRVSQT